MLNFHQLGPSGPSWSRSRDICLYMYMSPYHVIYFQASYWSILTAGSTRQQPIDRINQAAADWQDQPGSSRLAGSTRQQTIGRISQVAFKTGRCLDLIWFYGIAATIRIGRESWCLPNAFFLPFLKTLHFLSMKNQLNYLSTQLPYFFKVTKVEKV